VIPLADYLAEKEVTGEHQPALGNVVFSDLAIGKGLHYLISTSMSSVQVIFVIEKLELRSWKKKTTQTG
jgi:hypothetical protein